MTNDNTTAVKPSEREVLYALCRYKDIPAAEMAFRDGIDIALAYAASFTPAMNDAPNVGLSEDEDERDFSYRIQTLLAEAVPNKLSWEETEAQFIALLPHLKPNVASGVNDAKVRKLEALARNWEIVKKDDGLWLILHGNNTTGKAAFRLADPNNKRIVVQVAKLLEEDRKEALAALDSTTPAPVERPSRPTESTPLKSPSESDVLTGGGPATPTQEQPDEMVHSAVRCQQLFEVKTADYYEGNFAKNEHGEYSDPQQADDFVLFMSGFQAALSATQTQHGGE